MAEPEVATPGSERPRTPGFATDLALLGLQGSTVDVRDDYLVVRTPVNPTFHWGNCLVLDRAPLAGSLESWLAVFAGEHPGAAHVAMGIDDPDTVVDPAEARALGLSVERDVVLQAQELDAPEAIGGITLRALDPTDDADWAAYVDMEVDGYDGSSGEDLDAHRVFLTRRFAGHRSLAASGRGAWFGAYLPDGRPVAGLGVFSVGRGLARYQDVVTHPDHRRRGIAAALLRHAGRWALAREEVRTLVIVADPEGPAIGVYRRAGFDELAVQWQLYRNQAASTDSPD
ncbi:MAG: GNAT family N-acetyltransferase [Nocardioidaceae bacterium]